MENGDRPRRWFVVGVVVGAVVPVPATVAALLFPAAERVAPLLVPGAVLLRPLSSDMAGWSGLVNMLLVSVANGLLYGAAAALLARVPRRRRDDATGPRRTLLRRLVLGTLALMVLAAVAVGVVAARYAEHAAFDLRAVALEAGFDDAGEVRVRYPFLTERLGMAARNEEPFPYGYATLDLELDGCVLYAVSASVVPDSRSWLPRRVPVDDVRFQLEHHEPATGAYRRVEFRTADELLDRLAADDPGARQPGYLCRLQSADAPADVVPAEPPLA